MNYAKKSSLLVRKKIIHTSLLFVFFAGALIANISSLSTPVRADNNGAGEIFTWLDPLTMQASGGKITVNGLMTFTEDIDTADKAYIYNGRFSFTVQSDTPGSNGNTQCYVGGAIEFYAPNKAVRLTSNRFPADSINTPGYTGPLSCEQSSKIGDKTVFDLYDGNYSVTNDRPGSGSETTPETPAQKVVEAYVCSYIKNSANKITVTVKNKAGSVVKRGDSTKSSEKDPDCDGVYEISFNNLKPGVYSLCTSINSKCQEFTKIVYKPSYVTLFLGDAPESANSTVIEIGLGIESSSSPVEDGFTDQEFGTYTLELRDGDKVVDSAEVNVSYNGAACRDGQDEGWPCSLPKTVWGYTQFENVEPGDYEICIAGSEKCVTVTKKRGERLRDVELILTLDEAKKYDTSGIFGDGESSCAVEGIGWIVCPVMTFLGTMTDIAFNFLSTTFLETKASYFNISGSNNSAYQAWSYMRNLANVAFVIAFLFIIYSQITGLGASNYGIKKLLPKIIVAAILVNISFFICQIAIDISNILGYSLKSLFDTIGTNFKSPDAVTEDASGNGFGIAAIIVGLLAAGIGLALALSIPVILAALLALTIIVFILLARTALIILLVVVAPLAFVAYLLPNTEDWYKKWQKMFTGLLLVFPIIAVVFGAAGLAAKIVNDAAGGDKMLQVMAIGIATIPLFAVPGLLKGAMSAAGAIGSKLSAASNKANSRATGSANKKVGERYQGSAFARGQALRKQGKEEFRNRRFTKAVAGEDTGLVGRMRRRASRGLTGRTFTGAGEFAQDSAEKAAKGASARAEAKEYGEAVEAATAAQRTMTVDDVAKIASTGTHNGQKVTEHERAAAIDRTMSSGGFSQRKEVLEGLATDKAGTSRELRNRAVSAAYSKGDQNIYGAGFGDQILDEGGSINSAADLASAAVTNAEEGHVAAEHLVQNGSATKYLVGATLASGNTVARGKLATARDAARSTGSTQAKIDPTIEGEFARL